MKQFSGVIKGISATLDKVAGIFIFLVMILVVSNILLRTIFNSPIKGTYELVGLMTAIAVSFGLAYCAFQKGHIAVGYIIERFPKKIQIIVSILSDMIALGFWSATTWYLAKYANTMMIKGLVTATAEIPVYPFIYLIAFGFLALCFVIAASLMTTLKEVVTDIVQEKFLQQFKVTESISEESI